MVRSALTVQEKAEIWRAYRAGASLRSISRTLGRTMEALRTLVAATGGRPPVVPRWSARWLADESVSRRSGAASVPRDDLHVVVRAAAGRAAEGADPIPALAPHGPSAARGTSGQWPGPTAKRGQHQRPSRRGGRSGRARALGRRPPAWTRQQRDRDAR